MYNIKKILSIIILLCFVGFLEVKSDESASDIVSQLDIDVKKINSHKWKLPIREEYIDNNEDDESEIFKLQWNGNGDFGKKYSDNLQKDKLLLKGKKMNVINPEINFNNNHEEEENEEATEENEELSSAPSRVLEPPFKYYSSSIHDLATEIIEKFPTTTESNDKQSKNNTFHIYEITSTKSSSPNVINDIKKMNEENFERSFIIDDLNNELKSSDSLRSVILNHQQINNNQDDIINYDKQTYNDEYKSTEINRENVIRSNRLSIKNDRRTSKSFYLNRGNRKYQKAVSNDETISVRDKTWSYPTDDRFTWKKLRPINRANNYRRFGTITRVYNLRSDEKNRRVGPVPGVPGRDYPIHQEHTHHHLQNTAARFLCPKNSNSHIYLADRASRCQIFYVCFNGDIGVPMMCPNGTLFSQELQVCDWWYNVKC